jgi:hypothetical protein
VIIIQLIDRFASVGGQTLGCSERANNHHFMFGVVTQ